MATSNYHYVNTSKCFAINPDAECDDEFYWDDLLENIKYNLTENGFNEITRRENDPHELRSFPSRVLAFIDREQTFNGLIANVTVYAVLRSGYYQGACLDWFARVEVEGNVYDDEIPTEADVFEILTNYGDMNVGMTRIQSKNVVKFLTRAMNELTVKTEKVFETISTPLVVTARFSNGETWYEKAS